MILPAEAEVCARTVRGRAENFNGLEKQKNSTELQSGENRQIYEVEKLKVVQNVDNLTVL